MVVPFFIFCKKVFQHPFGVDVVGNNYDGIAEIIKRSSRRKARVIGGNISSVVVVHGVSLLVFYGSTLAPQISKYNF
jgi:hypothetical protein